MCQLFKASGKKTRYFTSGATDPDIPFQNGSL